MKKIFSVFALVMIHGLAWANTDLIYPIKDIEWLNLLHYSGSKSQIDKDSDFFLTKTGYKNPKAEYIATAQALVAPGSTIHCRYPARANFIKKHNPHIKYSLSQCNEYLQFVDKVPVDSVAVVFAAENSQSPASMMGHSFLLLSGKNEQSPQHAFGYMAKVNDVNPIRYILGGLFFGLDGFYQLTPYIKQKQEYLNNQQRSLWQFELMLDKEQKELLKQHIWELKDHEITYSMLDHNCNDATIEVLKLAGGEFANKSIKPFVTPIEYIQNLDNKNLITKTTLVPTDKISTVVYEYGVNDILDAPKPMRLSVSAVHQKEQSGVGFDFSPVYQDIHDITHAYFDDIESKIMNVSGRYMFSNGIVLDKLDVLSLKSVLDYNTERSFSKYLKLSFENTPISKRTRLNPTAEFGLGIGWHMDYARLYVLPRIGYKYIDTSAIYVVPEVGLISRLFDDVKLIITYEPYISSAGTVVQYSNISGYIGYRITKNTEFFFDGTLYPRLDNRYSLKIGVNTHF